jgi:group I intron endonuclease
MIREHTSGIYKIFLGNNFYYHGQSSNLKKREQQHMRELKGKYHRNKKLQFIYNKYEKFDFRILLFCDVKNLNFYEQQLLDGYIDDPKCCNIAGCAEASARGVKRTVDVKEKKSDSMKQYFKDNPEALRAFREVNVGRVPTKETREKLAKARKLFYQNNPDASTNRVYKTCNRNKKPVIVISPSGEKLVFSSEVEASKCLQIKRGTINSWILGKRKPNKSSAYRGYKFEHTPQVAVNTSINGGV